MKRVLQPRFLLIALLLCAIFFAYPDSALTKAEELSSSANDAITVEIVDDNDLPENPPDNTPENTPPLNNDQEPELNLNITENPVKRPFSWDEYRERHYQLIEQKKSQVNRNTAAALSKTEYSDEVIEVWTAEDLYNVRYNLSGHYIQMQDIDLSEYEDWEPIGDYNNPFEGSYNGNNFIISGLTINRPEERYIGLFGYIESNLSGSVFKNISLINVNISGKDYVGALVGNAAAGYNDISDIYILSEFINCHSNGTIRGYYQVGGLIGCGEANISDSSSSCNISGIAPMYTLYHCGGLFGTIYTSYISNCFATGSIDLTIPTTERPYDIGGFASRISSMWDTEDIAVVVNCYSTVRIDCNGSNEINGLSGFACGSDVNLESCYAVGDVVGNINCADVCGFVGSYYDGTMTNCYFVGNVSGGAWTSGFINNLDGTITNCYFVGNVSGAAWTFGFVERNYGTINNCYSVGNVTYVGDYLGGTWTSGFVGWNHGSISDCYYRGDTIGGDTLGEDVTAGFSLSNYDGTITNCYLAGSVTGFENFGGFIAENGGTLVGCYYDSELCTIQEFYATPQTTAEMKLQETYVGWDFENIWGIDPNENDGYPYLRAGGKVISKDLLGLRPFCGYNGSVNLSTGNFIQQNTDIAIPLPGPGLQFTRFYNSQDDYTGPLGKGWTHNYNVHLAVNPDGSIAVSYADGHVYVFTLDGSDYSPPPGCYEELALGPDDGYTLTFKDHSAYIFNASGQLESITDQNGNSLEFTYSSDLLTTVNDPGSGQTLSLDYDSENHLTEITDLMSRSVAYGYTDGNLTTVQDLNGGLTQYGYDAHGLTTITLPEGNTVLTNSYDDSSRVLEQSDALTNSWQYAYSDSQTTITGPENDVTGYGYDDHFCGISVTDPQGAETVYGYDQNYNCTSIIDAYENEQTFAYDDRGNLTSATNVFGTTEYEYDSNDNLITITDPEEKETSFTYDSNHNLTEITDPDNAVTSFTYYADGQIHTRTNPETDAGTGTVTYTYDDGFPDTITDPLGNTATLSYDLAGRLLSITNDLGKTTAYSYDDAGNLLSVTDPLQNSINLEYNGNNQIIAFTDANQNVTTYGYDDNNNLINVTDALNQTTAYAYDSNNRLASVTDARNNTTLYSYDLNGRLTAITDALGHTISYDYDDVGNITQITDALQNPVYSYEYDPVTYLMESVKDALNNTNTLQYDTMGRLTQHTNPLQHSSQFDYDNVNRHNQTTDAIQGVASQGFDALGARINLTDSNNNERDYSFDLLGRLTSRSTATGTVEYAYNEIGQLSTFTNGRDQNRTWEYDDAGRPISMTDLDGTITYTYDGNGNLLTVTDAQGAITRQYDALNRVISYTDAGSHTIGYQYDEVGNLTKLTYPDNKQVEYTYDAAGRLTQVKDWAGRITTYVYDANNRLIETNRPDGSKETRAYNEAGQLTQLKDQKQSGSILYQYDYVYDAAGNLTDENGTLPEPANAPDDSSVTCTTDNRMATYNGQTVTYDADGNLNSGPLNGQMTQYTFNSRNQLTAVGSSTYAYDAEGHRIGVNISGTEYDDVINPQAALSQVLVRTGPGSQSTYYIYGLGLIGEQSQNGYRVYHPDFRGSTVMMTDSGGSVTDRYMYDAYGNLMNHSGSSDSPFLYNGQYGIMTDGNGLVYMRARYYNPEVRRFVSQDSIEGDIGNPLSLNLHTYCSNNPINYLDPTGHISVERSVYLYNMRFFDNDLGNRDWARNEIEKLNPFEQAQMAWIIKYIRAKENYVNSVIENSGPYDAQAAADAFDVSMAYLGGEAVAGGFVITKGAGKSLSNISPNIRNAFGSDAKITTLTQDTTVYRYYGGNSKASSNWFTPYKVNNPASELALPPGNTAEFVDTVILPKGTRVIEGTVAPQPQWGQPGGGYQYYVLP